MSVEIQKFVLWAKGFKFTSFLSEPQRSLLTVLLQSKGWNRFFFVATLAALFNDQLAFLFGMPKYLDIPFGLLSALFSLMFFVEIVLTMLTKERYFFRLYFLLDCMACYSLLPDVAIFLFAADLDTPSTLAVARAARFARIGMRLGRSGRLAKLFSLGKMIEGKDDTKDPTFIGRVLLEVTTRKIVMGAVILLVTIPFVFGSASEEIAVAQVAAQQMDTAANQTIALSMLGLFQDQFSNLIFLQWKEMVLVDLPHDHLRFFEREDIQTKDITAYLDIRPILRDEAGISIIATLYSIFLLIVGTMFFAQDINRMIIVPVENLKGMIERFTQDFDSLESSGKEGGGSIEAALTKVSAIMQINLNMTNVFDPESQGQTALDEVIHTMGSSRGILFWVDRATSALQFQASRTDREESWIVDQDEIAEYVMVVVEVVERQMKPILVNSKADLVREDKGHHITLSPSANNDLRRNSILVTPLQVKGRFVGVIYMEKTKVYKKDMSKLLGEGSTDMPMPKMTGSWGKRHGKMMKSSSVGAGNAIERTKNQHLKRTQSFRQVGNLGTQGNYTQRDLATLSAVGNQAAIVLELTRSVGMEVENRWHSTMERIESVKKKQAAERAVSHKRRQLHRKEIAESIKNFDSLLAKADIPYSPYIRRRSAYETRQARLKSRLSEPEPSGGGRQRSSSLSESARAQAMREALPLTASRRPGRLTPALLRPAHGKLRQMGRRLSIALGATGDPGSGIPPRVSSESASRTSLKVPLQQTLRNAGRRLSMAFGVIPAPHTSTASSLGKRGTSMAGSSRLGIPGRGHMHSRSTTDFDQQTKGLRQERLAVRSQHDHDDFTHTSDKGADDSWMKQLSGAEQVDSGSTGSGSDSDSEVSDDSRGRPRSKSDALDDIVPLAELSREDLKQAKAGLHSDLCEWVLESRTQVLENDSADATDVRRTYLQYQALRGVLHQDKETMRQDISELPPAKQLERLRNEQHLLHVHLDTFQKAFYERHGHQPNTRHEQRALWKDYRRYKELRQEIQRLESSK